MSKSIEELQDEIDELKQERDELQGELDDHSNELSNREEEGYDRAMLSIESKIEHAFNAGYDACCTGSEQLRGLLNYNMEQRL